MRAVRFTAPAAWLHLEPSGRAAFAEEKFPNRPVKFVVGFLAGGPNDIVARISCVG